MVSLLFSIIVPVYNVAEFLPKCLESIKRQSYKNFEVIMVDDGSTDRSGDICNEYANNDTRFKIVHKKNGGLVSARQTGLQEAKGEYIVCVDSDDWISLNYLSTFEKEIRNNAPDIICCGYFIVNGSIKKRMPLPNRAGHYNRREIKNEIFPMLIQTKAAGYFRPSLWAKAFRKELYEQQQRQVDGYIKNGEDGACTIPCIFFAKSMLLLPECMYFYRKNPYSITQNRKPLAWDGPKLISQHLERQMDMSVGDFQEQLYRKTVHELFSVIVTQFYRDERKRIIVEDIKHHLADPYYINSIAKCHFSGSAQAKIMHFSLKYRWLWLIRLYANIKK